MKKSILLVIVFLFIICLLFAGCRKIQNGGSQTTTAGPGTNATSPSTTRGETLAITDAVGETVLQLPDESHGISVLSKTSPVQRGNSVNIIIMGKADHTYSITFRLDGEASALKGEPVSGNEVGIATWNLEVPKDLATGVYEAAIRDTADGSEDYVITHIEVK